jgi:hypothetical protein
MADLESLGIEDINDTEVKCAWVMNGKPNLVLNATAMNKKLFNTQLRTYDYQFC